MSLNTKCASELLPFADCAAFTWLDVEMRSRRRRPDAIIPHDPAARSTAASGRPVAVSRVLDRPREDASLRLSRSRG